GTASALADADASLRRPTLRPTLPPTDQCPPLLRTTAHRASLLSLSAPGPPPMHPRWLLQNSAFCLTESSVAVLSAVVAAGTPPPRLHLWSPPSSTGGANRQFLGLQ